MKTMKVASLLSVLIALALLLSACTAPFGECGFLWNTGCPATAANASTVAASDASTIFVNGVAVGVLNPQTEVGHPSFYLETGKTGAASWNVQAPSGSVIIAGGTDINDLHDGVLQAWNGGGSPVSVTVKNGFILVTTADWASQEFCFRKGQMVQFNWARKNVVPLKEWTACN